MASTNFDMDSDEKSYDSESEFYYPDEMEITMIKKRSGEHEENSENARFTMASVQKYILSQRPETDTVKKKHRVRLTRLEKILS